MGILFLEYPKCTTCQKAKKWLLRKQVPFVARHIVENRPTKEELNKWILQSGLPIKRFFNTSGRKYKELGLKDKLVNMSQEEMVCLLALDGMLVKRPILVTDKTVAVGFREEDWEEALKEM